MSEANRAQVTSYLNDAWSFLRQDLAESRSLTTAEIDSLANSLPLLQSAENLLFANLVDTLLYEPEMKAYLRTLLNIGEDDKIPSATVAEMNSVTTKQVKKTDNTIALLYASGNIISGNGSLDIQDKYMVSEIEKLKRIKK